MKTVTFSGTIENAWGKPLEKPLAFEGSYKGYENFEELKSANAIPSNDDLVAFVNNRLKATARQKAMITVLEAAGYEKPTLENDKELQFKTIVKSLLAAGKTEAESRNLAESALGFSID